MSFRRPETPDYTTHISYVVRNNVHSVVVKRDNHVVSSDVRVTAWGAQRRGNALIKLAKKGVYYNDPRV